jgi:hypothetical protein
MHTRDKNKFRNKTNQQRESAAHNSVWQLECTAHTHIDAVVCVIVCSEAKCICVLSPGGLHFAIIAAVITV